MSWSRSYTGMNLLWAVLLFCGHAAHDTSDNEIKQMISHRENNGMASLLCEHACGYAGGMDEGRP
jgi:trehalose utilization protein